MTAAPKKRRLTSRILPVRIALAALGAAFVLACFVNPSGLVEHNITGIVGLPMLLAGIFWRRFVALTDRGALRLARLGFFCLTAFYVLSFAAMSLAIHAAARAEPSPGRDAVIVLGAGLVGGNRIPVVLRQRLDAALGYLRENPGAVVVVTGGLGRQATMTEAYAMGAYLVYHGIPPERVILEERSTSTLENLSFARELLDEHFGGGGYTVVVATNDFHVPRSLMHAGQAGLDAEGLAAPTQRHMVPRYYSREHLALLWHLLAWPLAAR